MILFFPLAFTEVCTEELCSVRDRMEKYGELKATVFAISVDSMFALKKFKEEKNYPFDLLSDFNKTVSQKYHALHDEFVAFGMKNVTKRAAFVIDQQQTIRYVEILDNPTEIPNFQAIENILKEIQSTSQ